MNDFFKRNLVWVTILLCIAGVVLSIIGIPIGNPIFFFVGIILAIPTIGYLIYQVFFDRDKVELNLAPTTNKISRSNITSIINEKSEILLADKITNEDDLESLYHGFANEQEISKKLHEVTTQEHERAFSELPEIVLPSADPNDFEDFVYEDQNNNTLAIETTTNQELMQQRETALTTPANFEPEIPDEIIEEEIENNIEKLNEEIVNEVLPTNEITKPNNNDEFFAMSTENTTISLDDPNFVPVERVMPETKPEQFETKNMIIRINPKRAELRKRKAEEKKALLAQINLENYLKRYFIETAACFLMNRTIYKDIHGIAPYNKFATNKETGLPEYTMSATKGRLYKFCTYLIDTERFIKHEQLYEDFVTAVESGVSLARISETLHPLYRKKYKKDFILNLSNREDWDNVIILVYNNYILNNDNFKDIFTRVPFEIPVAYNEPNIIDYLKDSDLQDRFSERYSALEEIGIPTFWDAIYICFINSIKQKLNITQLETAILREYKKIARGLKRADNARRKLLKVS